MSLWVLVSAATVSILSAIRNKLKKEIILSRPCSPSWPQPCIHRVSSLTHWGFGIFQCGFVELNQQITYVNDAPPPEIIASQCKEKALGKASLGSQSSNASTKHKHWNELCTIKSCMFFNHNICILILDLTLCIHIKHKFHWIFTKM